MHLRRRNRSREAHQETREFVKSAFNLARALGIKTLVVQADEISDRRLVEQVCDDECKQMPVSDPAKDVALAMPDADLNRLSQLNLDAASRQVAGGRLTLRPPMSCRSVHWGDLRAGRPPHPVSPSAPVNSQSIQGTRRRRRGASTLRIS